MRGVIGELDQVAATFFEDLEGKTVLAGVGDERAVQSADAADVALGYLQLGRRITVSIWGEWSSFSRTGRLAAGSLGVARMTGGNRYDCRLLILIVD